MPVYDYHCNHCGREVALFYRSYKDYDAAQHVCPECGSIDLTRRISRVAIAKPGGANYASMSSGEMLNVLEGGSKSEVNDMYRQLGQDTAITKTLNDIGGNDT